MNKLDSLKPKVRQLARHLIFACRDKKINIVITDTFRSVKEQDELYELGRTKPGKIVTQVKGGESFHNYGVAFDFCPVKDGNLCWTDIKLFDKIGRIGKKLGLEWGGSWRKFKDRPHFQLTLGYSIEDFKDGKVDWRKFL